MGLRMSLLGLGHAGKVLMGILPFRGTARSRLVARACVVRTCGPPRLGLPRTSHLYPFIQRSIIWRNLQPSPTQPHPTPRRNPSLTTIENTNISIRKKISLHNKKRHGFAPLLVLQHRAHTAPATHVTSSCLHAEIKLQSLGVVSLKRSRLSKIAREEEKGLYFARS